MGCGLVYDSGQMVWWPNNPGLVAALNEGIRLSNAYADVLHRCEAEAARTGRDEHCTVDVPSPWPVSGRCASQ
jgi:hypothetical protein